MERTQEKIDEEYRLACSELGHNQVMTLRLQTQKEDILKKLQGLLEETKMAQEKAAAEKASTSAQEVIV